MHSDHFHTLSILHVNKCMTWHQVKKMSSSLFNISAWSTSHYFFKHRLIIKSSFELTFWIRLDSKLSYLHFQLNLSWVAHIFNLTRLDSTENWVNSTRLVKNLSLTSRELNCHELRAEWNQNEILITRF